MDWPKESSSSNISPPSPSPTGSAWARKRWLGGDGRPESFSRKSSYNIIEGTHLSGMLTYWVLETVAKELGDWLLANKEVAIGVNVPPEILGRGGLEYAAVKTGLSKIRNQIILEVTERGVPDSQGIAALEAASRSGVRIALDDVTLSSANLFILSRCTLDMIKTDRSLVDQITPESPCPAWLSGLTALLQSIRVEVIAEGVQTKAQAEALLAAGISMAQGYYFSPPISAEQLKAYHATRKVS